MTIEMIPLNKLRPSKNNPRRDFDKAGIDGLAASIKTDGLLQNLVVFKDKPTSRVYRIISGERRFRALTLLVERGDLPTDLSVPADVRDGIDDEQSLRIATVENLQRQDMTPIEEAKALNLLIGEGEKLDTLCAQTGLSITTIRRRLSLLNLLPAIHDHLTQNEITLAQAEALSIGSQRQQEQLLQQVLNGWPVSASDIRDRITNCLPSIAEAIFPLDQYTGAFVTDLFGDEQSTYFEDTEAFYDLQKVAAKKIVANLDTQHDWAILAEMSFTPWEYRQAEDGESGGVVVAIDQRGIVEIHKGLILKSIDDQTAQSLKPAKRASYSKSVVEYAAMHKSIALQAASLFDPRALKEADIARRLAKLHRTYHACLTYIDELETTSAALEAINNHASALLSEMGLDGEDADWSTFMRIAHSEQDYVALLKPLSDETLEKVGLFVATLQTGQKVTDELDCCENSLFNQLASSIGVKLRRYWCPDSWFLSRRTMGQLSSLIRDAGVSRLYGNANGYKKSELVQSLARYFAKIDAMPERKPDQQHTADWLPDIMHYPAIDPSKVETSDDARDLAA